MWLLIVIIAHFFNSLVFVIDKVILSKAVLKPISYAFFIGSLSILALFLIPFGAVLPDIKIILVGLATGASLMTAIFLFLRALSRNEASRIVPVVGGLVPIFTFTFSYLFLGERLTGLQVLAIFFLVIGGVLISIMKRREKYIAKGFLDGLIAALFFSTGYTLTKYIFLNVAFLSGFITIRVGSFLFVLLFLLVPTVRKTIFKSAREILRFRGKRPEVTLPLFILSKSFAAIAAVGIDFSIYLASATLVNSLQGVQYVFLLFLAALFSKRYRFFPAEGFRGIMLVQKIIAIVLISGGLVLLSI